MTYLSEDPTVLAGSLLLLAAAFGVALKVTQQGKYLICALIATGLATAVVAVEWMWVTDTERIEDVVYDLRQAVLDSDTDRVMAHLTPNVQFLKGDLARDGEAARSLIQDRLSHITFDFIGIRNLQTNAGQQSRRGSAEFGVLARTNLGTGNSIWSLGFQETQPGVWKVNRISPVQIPYGALTMPSGSSHSNRIGRGGGRRAYPPRVDTADTPSNTSNRD
jgi:hypothetical protein